MTDRSEILTQLRAVEEQVRDLAYEALRAAADGDQAAAAEEKRLLKARRALERAVHALEPGADADQEC